MTALKGRPPSQRTAALCQTMASPVTWLLKVAHFLKHSLTVPSHHTLGCSAMIPTLRGHSTNGKRVCNCEAVEEGTRQSREPVVRIERSASRFCWNVLRQRSQANTQTSEDVSSQPKENCGGSTCAVGQSEEGEEESCLGVSQRRCKCRDLLRPLGRRPHH